jgi:hypothetical protein
MRKVEKRIQDSVLGPEQRNTGYHYWGGLPETQEQLEELVIEYERNRKVEAKAERRQYVEEPHFAVLQKIKAQEWKALSDRDRIHYRKLAEKNPKESWEHDP